MRCGDSGQHGDNRGYWDEYYRHTSNTAIPVPSQFAIFVLGELQEVHAIIDVGCGTGRDSLYIASRGHRVLGIDESGEAIRKCIESSSIASCGARFMRASIADSDLMNSLIAFKVETNLIPIVVYARFFLHAVTEKTEETFLSKAAFLCKDGGLLAVEFRTVRDRSLSKVTSDHYRRYVEPANFLAKAYLKGFSSEYYVEGFGFAKYRQDDAYVVRCLLRRN